MATRDQAVEIHTQGGSICGTLIAPVTQLPGVLFVHGWGGSQQHYIARAHAVAALGCISLAFDLTGHAGTLPQRETVTREQNLADVLAAYDLLSSHPLVDSDAIAVVGSSYGGYLGAILTSLRPVRWLALRAPALYRDSGWELPKERLRHDQDLDTYRRTVIPAEANRALRACAAFKGDLLVVESERDVIVPHAVVTSYREACLHTRSLTYRVLEGADHGLATPESQRAYNTLLINWLGEMVAGARRGEEPAPALEPERVMPETPPPAG